MSGFAEDGVFKTFLRYILNLNRRICLSLVDDDGANLGAKVGVKMGILQLTNHDNDGAKVGARVGAKLCILQLTNHDNDDDMDERRSV